MTCLCAVLLLSVMVGNKIRNETTDIVNMMSIQLAERDELSSRLSVTQTTDQVALDPLASWVGTEQEASRAMQQFVLDALSANSLSLSRYYESSGKPEAEPLSFGLILEFEGSLLATLGFLKDIETSRPAIAVSAIDIGVAAEWAQVPGETRVRSRLELWGYFVEQGAK